MSIEEEMDLINDIQEVTLQACSCGVFDFLFTEMEMDRPSILTIFQSWGEGFYNTYKNYQYDGTISYYDLIDEWVGDRFQDLKAIMVALGLITD